MNKYPARKLAVAAVLREARLSAGLSQRALSLKLKKAANYAYKIEAGRRGVRVEELIAWSEACDVSPSVLMSRIMIRPQGCPFGPPLASRGVVVKPAEYMEVDE